MTAIRRKRDDDSTIRSNSQCSTSQGGDPSLAAMDASHSSMVALDASTVGTDSSIPRRHRKRRRTTILDQLQQINISNGAVGVPDQILGDAAAPDDNSQTLTSSSGSEDEDDEHPHEGHHRHGNHEHHRHHDPEEDDDHQILPLSDMEQAQRAVMREIVFGRPPDPPPPNLVDRKLQAMIRQSLQNVQQGQHPLFLANNITESQDDMTIDPVYTRPSGPDFFFPPVGAAMGPPPGAGASWTCTAPLPPMQPPQRMRSNSLPEGLMSDLEDTPMEDD